MYLYKLRRWRPLKRLYGCQRQVRDRGLGPWPRLNASPVCDDNAAEANVALYK